MSKSITNKFAVTIAAVAMAFGMTLTAFAYDALEIEVDILAETTEVEVQYEEGGDVVTEEYIYNTTDLEEVYVLLAAELELTEQDVEDAVVDIDEYDEVVAEEAAADAIADAEDAIADLETYIDGLDEESTSTIEEFEAELLVATGLLADAKEAFDAEDYQEAEALAADAEAVAEDVLDTEGKEDEDEEEEDEGDDEDDDKSTFCERTKQAAGWGVAKKCVNDDNYVVNDKLAKKVTRFEDFGKSTDRIELQSQLQQLLLLLIELLQQQAALKAS